MEIVACDRPAIWDRYVRLHPQGGPFHLFGWKNVFEKTYHLPAYYLMAVDSPSGQASAAPSPFQIKGILALALVCSPGRRRRLVSLPYLDVAGVLADDRRGESRLIEEAIHIARSKRARWIELRQAAPLACHSLAPASGKTMIDCNLETMVGSWQVSSHKAGLQRPLPSDSRQLMQSFKSKLRSQVKKAMKNGLTCESGGTELLPAFYGVFARNMRDLGSPIHHYRFFETVFATFGDRACVVLVRRKLDPVAASVVLLYGNRSHNPWASSVKDFRKLGTNMLLYWAMLAHACDHGMDIFDFGRSSPGAGTYVFKQQWEARPTPLYWYYLTLDGDPVDPMAETLSFTAWKRLPVWLSRLIGPHVRRHISL